MYNTHFIIDCYVVCPDRPMKSSVRFSKAIGGVASGRAASKGSPPGAGSSEAPVGEAPGFERFAFDHPLDIDENLPVIPI